MQDNVEKSAHIAGIKQQIHSFALVRVPQFLQIS